MPFASPYMISYLSSSVTIYLAPFLRYYRLFPQIRRRHMTLTKPIQGTVCNANAKPSPGEPVYKI